tara:strand:+ start:335 stop:469 length:135 start_codon:yes stop_codon:yes gene_type:complete
MLNEILFASSATAAAGTIGSGGIGLIVVLSVITISLFATVLWNY